jgi:hypothetical protein
MEVDQPGDGYGVSIRQEIERCCGREVTIGAVYATLSRLEEKGLASSYEGEAVARRGGRARRHFRIEPASSTSGVLWRRHTPPPGHLRRLPFSSSGSGLRGAPTQLMS